EHRRPPAVHDHGAVAGRDLLRGAGADREEADDRRPGRAKPPEGHHQGRRSEPVHPVMEMTVIARSARATKQSRHHLSTDKRDCFAPLAMTSLPLLPLAKGLIMCV